MRRLGQRFYFDGNVVAMEEITGKTAGGRTRPVYGAAEERRTAFSGLHYYLQDELGSPLCVSGYGKGEGAGVPGYLTYGYDEFGNGLGNDLGKELDEAGIPNPYDRQGEEQPFGYTGYRYDGISGTYFAQAREYQTGNGRFTTEDVVKGNGLFLKTLNRYGYCWGNPIKIVDLNGKEGTLADKIIDIYADDEKGKELVERYVYGDGSDYIIDETNDGWSNYMMANDTLTIKTGQYLAPIGKQLAPNESIEVDMTISMIIDDANNDHSGYMLLYGTNKDVGGYQIQGTISKDGNGTITYDMKYTFNDIMDPNFKYAEDKMGYNVLKVLQNLNNNVTMNNYNLKISWTDKTIVYSDGKNNSGWLSEMQYIYPSMEIYNLEDKMEHSPWWMRGNKPTMEEMIRYYKELQQYMNSHPEYYESVCE